MPWSARLANAGFRPDEGSLSFDLSNQARDGEDDGEDGLSDARDDAADDEELTDDQILSAVPLGEYTVQIHDDGRVDLKI